MYRVESINYVESGGKGKNILSKQTIKYQDNKMKKNF